MWNNDTDLTYDGFFAKHSNKGAVTHLETFNRKITNQADFQKKETDDRVSTCWKCGDNLHVLNSNTTNNHLRCFKCDFVGSKNHWETMNRTISLEDEEVCRCCGICLSVFTRCSDTIYSSCKNCWELNKQWEEAASDLMDKEYQGRIGKTLLDGMSYNVPIPSNL